MLDLQMRMNCTVNPDWLSLDWDFDRAIMMEGSEAIDHLGWKHWKKIEPDYTQLRMELVDIWHFVLARAIQQANGNMTIAYNDIESRLTTGETATVIRLDRKVAAIASMSLLEKLETLVGLAAADRFSFVLFNRILTDVGMSSQDLFREYVTKNVLNIFRQNHGYKEGTYIKIWNGSEDNVHLVDLATDLDTEHPQYGEVLYELLTEKYVTILEQFKEPV